MYWKYLNIDFILSTNQLEVQNVYICYFLRYCEDQTDRQADKTKLNLNPIVRNNNCFIEKFDASMRCIP